MKFYNCGRAKLFLIVAIFLIAQFFVMDNYVRSVVMGDDEIERRVEYALNYAEREVNELSNGRLEVNEDSLELMGVSLTVSQGDSVIYWCGSPYDRHFESSLKFHHSTDNLTSEIKIFLENDFGDYNHYLFKSLSDTPDLSLTKNVGDKIQLDGEKFYIDYEVRLPLLMRLIGLVGLVCLLVSLQLFVWCGVTSLNVFRKILLLSALYLVVWIALCIFIGYECKSIIPTIFIFLITRALYISRSKLKYNLNALKPWCKRLFYLVYSLSVFLVICYFYKMLTCLASSGYLSSVDVDNILHIDGNALFFYFLFSVQVAVFTRITLLSKLLLADLVFWHRVVFDLLVLVVVAWCFDIQLNASLVAIVLCPLLVYFLRGGRRLFGFVVVVLLLSAFITQFTIQRIGGGFYDYIVLWSYLSIFIFITSSTLVILSGGKIFRYVNRKTMNCKYRIAIYVVAFISIFAVICMLLFLSVWGDMHTVKKRAEREILLVTPTSLPRNGAIYSAEDCTQICDSTHILSKNLPREIFEKLRDDEDSCVFVEVERHSLVCRRSGSHYLVLLYDNSKLSIFESAIGLILNISVIILFVILLILLFVLDYFVRPLNNLYNSLPKIDKLQKINNFSSSDNELSLLVSKYNHLVDSLEMSYDAISKGEQIPDVTRKLREIVHEIRNPLTPIKLKLGMLEYSRCTGGKFHEEHLQETLSTLMEQIEVIERVLDRLTGVFNQNASNGECELILPILQRIKSLYSIDDKIFIDIVIEKERDVRAIIDRLDFTEVLSNLIKNSVEAMGENGGEITLTLHSEKDRVFVIVDDSGDGIDTEIMPYIFDENFSTKGRGTGIGLSICREIIEGYGGKITACNNSIGGARFIISLDRSTCSLCDFFGSTHMKIHNHSQNPQKLLTPN